MYGRIAVEKKYISRYPIALDFKKFQWMSQWKVPVKVTGKVPGRGIHSYIHGYTEYIRVYTSIYFAEAVYVRISQYIGVYTQICKVHMSIYEYILLWSVIFPLAFAVCWMGVWVVQGTMRARCYPFDMPKRLFHSFNPKVCKAFCNLSCQYIIWHSLYKVYTWIYVVYHSLYGYVPRCAVFLCAGYHTCGPSLSFLHWRG